MSEAMRSLSSEEWLSLATRGYWRARRWRLEHHDAQDLAAQALARTLTLLQETPQHPAPSALYHRVLHGLFVEHVRTWERRETLMQRLQPAEEGTLDRMHTLELQAVCEMCERAGLLPGSRTWLAAMHTALGDGYEDMVSMWPGTTLMSWRKAWSRARALLQAQASEEEVSWRE